FFDELAEWGESTGFAAIDRGPERAEENPLIGYRERFVRDWPGPALRPEADGLFPEGWRRTAVDVSRDPAILKKMVDELPPAEREAFEQESGELATLAAHLTERESAAPEPP